jgi:hypothetical protein
MIEMLGVWVASEREGEGARAAAEIAMAGQQKPHGRFLRCCAPLGRFMRYLGRHCLTWGSSLGRPSAGQSRHHLHVFGVGGEPDPNPSSYIRTHSL